MIVQTRPIMIVGGEPLVNAWVRDGLAAAPHTFVLALQTVDLATSQATPPQAVRRLLNPSFATAVRQSAAQDGVLAGLRHALSQTMHSQLGHRPIAGIPEGLGFAEWLADECNCSIVCLASHPFAMAAHHKRIAAKDDPTSAWLERACREWLVAGEWLTGFQGRRRDFAFVTADELIGEPFVGFHRLYRQLDLDWSTRSQSTIASMMDDDRDSSPSCGVRPQSWRKMLTSDEIIRIRDFTEKLSPDCPVPRSEAS